MRLLHSSKDRSLIGEPTLKREVSMNYDSPGVVSSHNISFRLVIEKNSIEYVSDNLNL